MMYSLDYVDLNNLDSYDSNYYYLSAAALENLFVVAAVVDAVCFVEWVSMYYDLQWSMLSVIG